MRRADRYVLTGFAVTLGATLALVAVLFIALDALQRLDQLVGYLGREGLASGAATLVRYYAARFLGELGSFGEVVAIVPAVAVAASMARSNEFVAILAAGRSLRRVALPLFSGCAALGLAVFCLRNFAGPSLVRSEKADRRLIYGQAGTLGRSLSVQGRSGPGGRAAVVLSLEEYDPARLRGRGFQAAVIEPGEPFVDIRAPVAVWDREGGRWLFPEGARRWTYDLRRRPGEGLRAVEEAAEFPTALGPELLEAEELGPGVLSLGALFRQRGRPGFAAELHGRLAQLFAPLLLAVAALPFVLTTERSRVVQGTLLCVLTVAGYEIVTRVLLGAAAGGHCSALVGGWLGPVAFGAVGAWRLVKMET